MDVLVRASVSDLKDEVPASAKWGCEITKMARWMPANPGEAGIEVSERALFYFDLTLHATYWHLQA